ncbi:putative aldose 1-/Glucose-6-phosphate 1-epimerase, galactose mutarotase-like domain superfamily [Helianthus debilis subsp. tardiflorus]
MTVSSSRQMMRLLHTILFVSVLVAYTEIVEATTTGNKSVEVTKGINGLEKVILRQTHGSSVEVYLYGAHVTSWKNEQGQELIFLSSKVPPIHDFCWQCYINVIYPLSRHH